VDNLASARWIFLKANFRELVKANFAHKVHSPGPFVPGIDARQHTSGRYYEEGGITFPKKHI
jgi:hypothetical protein